MSIYAVNGKEPIAAWIPSLDDVGNGTATLTDLVGTNDGTLTNMDAATDWVSDTDAGGVRALDFDGVDDYVMTNLTGPSGASARTFSAWVKSIDSVGNILSYGADGGRQRIQFGFITAGKLGVEASGHYVATSLSSHDGVWHHITYSIESEVLADSAKLYVDGVEDSILTGANEMLNTFTINKVQLGRWFGNGNYLAGLLDDVRIFDQALDSADIAYLYASGLGRGITSGNPTANVNNTIRNVGHAL